MKTKQMIILTLLIITLQIYCANPRRYVTQDGSGLKDGSSWVNAGSATDLQNILDSVQDTDIWIAKGVYKPTKLVLEPESERDKTFGPNFNLIYGGFAGNETDLSQRDIRNNETIFSGDIGIEGDNSDNCYHVIRAVQILDGVTIRDGYANGYVNPNASGGGVYVWSSPSIFKNCTFRDNYSSQQGGAVFMDTWGYDVIFENCLFYNNESKNGGGGAVLSYYTSTIMTGCTFVKNISGDGSCVDVPYRSNDDVLINNNIFWKNTGGDLGAENVIYSISHNAVEGGYDGFANINLSSNNTGDVNSPYFTDPDNNDYSLLPQSPLIDKGVYWNTSSDTDITGETRPQGLSWDFGAYEYNSGPLTTVPPSVSTLTTAFTTVSSARVHGNVTSDGGSQMITKGVYYSTSSGFDPATQGTLIKYNLLYSEGEFYLDITNLPPNTTYYYRIYCENRIGSDTGDEMSFTTRSGVSPDANGILYVKPDGTGDGSSWANALNGNDLQLGIDNTSVKEIWLAKGKYVPTSFPNGGTIDRQKHFSLKQNVVLYGGFNGTETALDQRDLKMNKTILSGDIGAESEYLDNTYHVFYHLSQPYIDSSAVIDGITISDGNAVSIARANSDKGGGMYNGYCSPTIRNCTFENNRALKGGGMYNSYASDVGSSAPFIYNTKLSNNYAIDKGGAIYNIGAFPNLSNCVITNNHANNTGGGIYHWADDFDLYPMSNGSLVMTQCTIAGNTSTESSQVSLVIDYWDPVYMYNNIIWGDQPAVSWYNDTEGEPLNTPQYTTISFSAIAGGYTGTGEANINLSSNNEGDTNSPYFTDPENNDYSLQYNSACKDMAIYRYKTNEDILGTIRPQGAAYDMGAYEFVTADPAGTIPAIETSFTDSINAVSAECHTNIISNGGTPVYVRGVKVSTAENFDPVTEGWLFKTAGDFYENEYSNMAIGLIPDTTYYYCSYAENRIGYTYGDQRSFITQPMVTDANGILYVKKDGKGTGSSWEDALNGYDLQGIIDHSNAEQIWVAKGKYTPVSWPWYGPDGWNFPALMNNPRAVHFALRSKFALYGGFEGTETSLEQRDYRSNETILSGDIGIENDNTDNAYCTVVTDLADSTAVLDGFTVSDAYNFDTENPDIRGGMYIFDSNLTIRNCVIKNNQALLGGGGIAIKYGNIDCNTVITNCIFENNYSWISGGGIYHQSWSTKLNVTNCIFRNNTAYIGGALTSWIYLKLKNCLIYNNSAHYASAIYINQIEKQDIFFTKIINCTIINNTSETNNDVVITFPSVEMRNTVIWGNSLRLDIETERTLITNCALPAELDSIYAGVSVNNIILSPNNSGDPNSPYFSDPDNNNWMIQEHSPLRNAGIFTDLVPQYDFAGNLRDSLPDIGCYEYDPTGIEESENILPLTTELFQNYPNPFNPATNIKFALSKSGKVELSVFNIAGQLVRKVIDKEMTAGFHSVNFEADGLNSGMYFYNLKANGKELTKKMLMVK